MNDLPLSILLVEDDEADGEYVAELLGGSAARVEICPTLSSAVDTLARGGIDVVLLDLDLPDAVGLDSIDSIHRVAPQMAVVILTGRRDDRLVSQAIECGAQDYLVKGTFSAELLLRTLWYSVWRQQSEQRLRQQTKRLETLNQFGQMLAAELDIHRLIRTVTTAAREIGSAEMAAWFSFDDDGERIAVTCSVRGDFATLTLPRATPILLPTLRDGLQHHGPDVGHVLARVLGPTTSCLSIPVVSHRAGVLGGIILGHSAADAFNAATSRAIRSLAGQTAVALDNARLLTESERERLRAEEGERCKQQELERAVRERTQALQDANQRLQELDRMKNEFLATMSHELRTPLNAIIGFSSLLVEGGSGPLNAAQEKQMRYILQAGEQLLDLINDILDVSRVEAGLVRLNNMPFSFSDIETAVNTLGPQALRKALRLEVRPLTPIPTLFTDGQRLRQVILNLVGNAVKFTARGFVEIDVSFVDQQLVIQVRDSGVGIRPRDLPLLFKPFQQVGEAAEGAYGGTGLGLYLSKKLVNLLGGELTVESEWQVGSTFTVRLPSAPPLREENPTVDAEVPVGAGEGGQERLS